MPIKGDETDGETSKRQTGGPLPDYARFCAAGRELEGHRIVMTVEEYETLRLIDYLEQTQEACAGRMGVGRGTVQSLYTSARKKLARFLVEGAVLDIAGRRVCAPRKRRTDRPAGPSPGRERRLSHEDSGYL